MQYLVIWSDGNKYGPADLVLLNQWAAEGRVTRDTELEPVDGSPRLRAADLPGLVIPGAAAPAPTPTVEVPAPAVVPQVAVASYYVLGPGGTKYGPADMPTLTKWMAENRLNAASELEDATTGSRLSAGSLIGAAPTSYQEPSYQQPVQQPQSQFPAGYGQAPGPTHFANPEAGKQEFTQSIVAAVVGFFCCPVIAPVFGIVKANQAKQMGHPNAQVAFILNIVVLALALIGVVINVAMIMAAGRVS